MKSLLNAISSARPFYVLITITLFLFSSCTKDVETPENFDSSINFISAQACFFDVFSNADGIGKTIINNNATFATTGKTSVSNNVVELAFEDATTMHRDGKSRTGNITMNFTNDYLNPNSKVEITLNNYKIGSQNINGTSTIESYSKNEFGIIVLKMNVDATINGKQFTSSFFYEWIEGDATETNYFDDVFEISGAASGFDSNNEKYSIEITQKVEQKVTCRWPSTGQFDLIPATGFPKIVNYGQGNCDNKVSVFLGLEENVVTIN